MQVQWNQLVRDLVGGGLTQKQIALEVGCGQATISDLMTGKAGEPRGSLALSLVALCSRRGLSVPGIDLPAPSPSKDSAPEENHA
jgi:hypothetical protein